MRQLPDSRLALDWPSAVANSASNSATSPASAPGGRITHEDIREYVKGAVRRQSSNLPSVCAAAVGHDVRLTGAAAAAYFSFLNRSLEAEQDRPHRRRESHRLLECDSARHAARPHGHHRSRGLARKRFGAGPVRRVPRSPLRRSPSGACHACRLQAFPKFNSSLDPETFELVFKQFYNIGSAVDTPNGLMVPVIHSADRKSILEIAAELGKTSRRKPATASCRSIPCRLLPALSLTSAASAARRSRADRQLSGSLHPRHVPVAVRAELVHGKPVETDPRSRCRCRTITASSTVPTPPASSPLTCSVTRSSCCRRSERTIGRKQKQEETEENGSIGTSTPQPSRDAKRSQLTKTPRLQRRLPTTIPLCSLCLCGFNLLWFKSDDSCPPLPLFPPVVPVFLEKCLRR